MNASGLNGLGAFVRAKAGMIAVLAVFAGAWYASLKYQGITALPRDFSDHMAADSAIHSAIYYQMGLTQSRVTVVEDSVRNHHEALLYTICTQIPPATRNEKRALRVECGRVERDMWNEIQSGGAP